ncbi:MAG: ABC transporter substrate-binding protein, partial [Alphaproteobacteria bacterium]|nr:ABC transporter substrate-binding protein [Alphaproteobacteria bacterium]
MTYLRTTVSFALGAGLALSAALGAPASAQELTKAEKIFAELAKMPAAEREKRIIEGAKKEGEINLIRSLRGKLGKGRIDLFRKRYPWLKVNESELGSQDAAYRMVAEETAGRHLTDVVSIAAADMQELLNKKIAARYPTPATKKVLPQYKEFLDKDNRWAAWALNEHGIVYNTNLVKNPPKTYMELCDPRFKGKISFEPSETRFLSAMYNVMG